ncbi:TPA: RHS repeat-associated core domain-containing protein [Bacillus toyonensis]|nr:RHS repeat-associated core domain-containing protein [Bacillus toyonensis]
MSLAFNAGNQLETYGNEKLKCDANGNRTADGKYSYTWNEADQLTTITKQGETTPFAKSVDPDPGDEDDPVTQNGYTYADNNPVMNVDSDGHLAWMLFNAGFAAYDGYNAYKKNGWKAAAIAVGVGLVGGATFKGGKIAYKAAKNWYTTTRHWSKGTFKSRSKSLAYHHKKHVTWKEKSYGQKRYTDMARSFYRSNKHLRQEVVLSNGKKGGYYTKNGKIITYWNNGWKKKKR